MTPSPAGREPASGTVDAYRASYLQGRIDDRDDAGAVRDELLQPDGGVRDGNAGLAATLDLLGVEGLRVRGAELRRLLEDDGVTYGVAPEVGPSRSGEGAAEAPLPGRWRLDPLPVVLSAQEWAELGPGLIQRAELLDAVLTDLYGPRELLKRGLLPAEVVFGHAGFIRACDGIRLPGRRQLVMAATDLVRGPDGWTALGDRAQAPSGAGYAMENRRVVSRAMPGLYRDTLLERLRSFFHALRAALQAVAPSGRTDSASPRVVILTPGQGSETAFDQAFLSTLLGFPLVEGEDLAVRDGRVWMRSMGRPEPVDVVLRRVDGWFADPLELRADSQLGVPGLLQAARLGHVSIVNPPGAGVLENPGLVPFLPALSRALLGAAPQLASAPTWWCGEAASRSHVLTHLDELVIRPLARGIGRANRFGWQLSAAQKAELRARIEAEPHAWCGQQALNPSTAPVVTPSGLEARRLVLRSFAVAEADSYRLMAGGLGRVAGRAGSLDVSSQAGALAKDVWVIGVRSGVLPLGPPVVPRRGLEGDPEGSVRLPDADEVDARAWAMGLSSRTVEDMFWLGRYAERAEDAVRLLRVAADLTGDHGLRPGSVGARSLVVMLRALTGVTTTFPGFLGDDADAELARPQRELLRVTVDPFAPGSLAHAVRHTVEAAHAVRDLLSPDTWLVLGRLDRVLVDLGRAPGDPDLRSTLDRVLEGLLALSGLAVESMVRDSGWHVLDAGRRIERGLQLTALLRHTLATARPAAVDDLVLESVLIAAESVITYRRRHPGRPRVDDVLDLLLTDPGNPRAVLYQLGRLAEDLEALPGGAQAGLREHVAELTGRLRQASSRELSQVDPDGERPLLAGFLDHLARDLAGLADLVARTHFARVLPPQPQPTTPTVDA